MAKRRPTRTALRRRSRAERPATTDYQRSILRELERAGAPLDADELAQRLRVPRPERRAFEAGVSELERSGEAVRNRAGALLIARRIAAVAGRVNGHPDGHGFLIPDGGG